MSISFWISYNKLMFLLQLLAKLMACFFQRFLHRPGSTWPGELALKLNPKIIRSLRPFFSQIIVIAGTNGKTSTSQFLVQLLKKSSYSVISNSQGANLANGVVSSILINLPLFHKPKKLIGVFELDEYAFSETVLDLKPRAVILLNLFRDQLDRYGEVTNILHRWQGALAKLKQTTVVYPSADPALESLFLKINNQRLPYFIPEPFLKSKTSVSGDYVYCPVCQHKLVYHSYYLGHLGNWLCQNCAFAPNKNSYRFDKSKLLRLTGFPVYQQINLQAVYLLLKPLKLNETAFWQTVKSWQPSFGRGETIKAFNRNYQVYLGKNPASWSAVINHFNQQNLKDLQLVMGLNNRVPDGHDISWIYDADFKLNSKPEQLLVFGDRAYDLAVRLKMQGLAVNKVITETRDLKTQLQQSKVKNSLILANYSAMLQVRQLLSGKSLD